MRPLHLHLQDRTKTGTTSYRLLLQVPKTQLMRGVCLSSTLCWVSHLLLSVFLQKVLWDWSTVALPPGSDTETLLHAEHQYPFVPPKMKFTTKVWCAHGNLGAMTAWRP